MITLTVQRDNYLAFLQVTYIGETLAAAERSADHLGHLMNHHIVHRGK